MIPNVARHADKWSIVRTLTTDIPNHPQAVLQLHTGSHRFTRPSIGSWVTDRAAWSRALAPLGVGRDTEVYIYDADRQHGAGRIWWLLAYVGLPKVGLVDGGFPLWERSKRPVSTESAQIAPQEFQPTFHPQWLVDHDAVRAAVGDGTTLLVDARSLAEYRGQKGAPDARLGHIPTARSLDAYDLVDADGRYLEESKLRERLSVAGVTSDRPIIVYSAGGGRSGSVLFTLERLGFRARHYLRGLSDWTKDSSALLETDVSR